MTTSKKRSAFVKALANKDLYPEATRQIKVEETRSSYIFKTGETVYKIKKTSHDYPNLAIKETFVSEEFHRGQYFAEGIYLDVVPLRKHEDKYTFSETGDIVDYAIKMKQLNERNFLSVQLEKKKVTPIGVGRIAKKLAGYHVAWSVEEEDHKVGRPEYLLNLFEDFLYELKRYFEEMFIQPMIDTIKRPFELFLDNQKKLLNRRMKKNRIVHGHGDLLPEHIYFKTYDIFFLSPEGRHDKFCVLDGAYDLACLTLELARLEENDLLNVIVKRYGTHAKDRDITKILPLYQVLAALNRSVFFAEIMMEKEGQEQQELRKIATNYLNLAIRFVRDFPR